MATVETGLKGDESLTQLPNGDTVDYLVAQAQISTELDDFNMVLVFPPILDASLIEKLRSKINGGVMITNEHSEFTEIGYDPHHGEPLSHAELAARVAIVLVRAGKRLNILAETVVYSEFDQPTQRSTLYELTVEAVASQNMEAKAA